MAKKQNPSSPLAPPKADHELIGHGGANKFESYQMATVHRSQLKNAPYNPRTISEKSRNKLKAKIKESGLVAPPTWNKRSGNIVGGHQRLSVLDSLHGTSDYSVTVAMVDVDDNKERELNIFLNNEEAQGEWDLQKLYSVFKEDMIDPEAAGFDNATIEEMFGENASVAVLDAEKLKKIADRVRESQETFERLCMENSEGDGDEDNPRFYAIAVFKSQEDKDNFLDAIGVETDGIYVDGKVLRGHVLDREGDAFIAYEEANFISRSKKYFM